MTPPTTPDHDPPPRTDRRVQRSREAVLAAAFALLGDSGLGGFSVDEVTRRSGVAKTTIYRHWPTREALVIDACSRFTDEQEVPDTGSVTGDVRAILTTIAHLLTTANWASVLPSIVDAAEREPALAEVHRRIQHGHAAPLRAVLDRARDRGELSADADISALVAALMGPLFYRRWFSREPVGPEFVDTLLTLVLRPCLSRTANAPS